MTSDDLRFMSLVACPEEHAAVQAIANTLDELAPDDVEVGPSQDVGSLPAFEPARSGMPPPPEVAALTSVILRADAVVIVSPDLAGLLPGPVENALAWLGGAASRPMSGKCVAMQTASSGPSTKLQACERLRELLQGLEAVVLDGPKVTVVDAHRRVDHETGCVRDAEARHLIGSQLAALARLVRQRRDQGSGSA